MQLAFPYRITGSGRTDTGGDHLREMIEQVLFTVPGERVNRPGFGSGLYELVFATEGDQVIAATQAIVQGALQQWLGEVIEVAAVEVNVRENQLQITVRYKVRRTGDVRTAAFDLE